MKFNGIGPLMVFCRLRGENRKIREVMALVEPNFEFCCVLRKDAAFLGYPSVTSRPQDWADSNPEEVVSVLSFRGIELGTLIRIKEVSVGHLRAENVKAVVTESEFPFMIPVGMFLGKSFLEHFKLEVDPKGGSFSLY